MRIRKTVVGAAAALALAGVAFGMPHHVGAAGGDVIAFDGATTSLTCNIGSGTSCTTGQGIPAVGGSGSYTFQTATVCSIEDSDRDGDGSSCTITSSGTYTSIACGTGTATGTATITGSAGVINVSYKITFVAGQGTLTGTVTEPDGTSANADGTVSIRPSTAPSGTTCTLGFNVVGTAVTTA